MLRWTDLDSIPSGPSVVTWGNFDGVHRGHQAVLDSAVQHALTRGVRAVAVTFDPHPLTVLRPDAAPPPVAGLRERLEAIEATGIDAVLVLPFTLELAAQSPEQFVEQVFVQALSAVEVVVGADTRFGAANAGDVGTLRELGARLGFEVDTLQDVGGSFEAPGPPQDAAGELARTSRPATTRWSSTQVRRLLADGAVEDAAIALGHPHRVSGVVVHGAHRGRELGYPTANLDQDASGLVPADGVYAGWLVREAAAGHPDAPLPAAVSIGTNPTFDGTLRTVEAYVLDRDDLDLYGERIGLDFVHRLRATERFESIEELLEQIAQDVQTCRRLLVG